MTPRSFHEDSRKASAFKGIWFKPGIFAAVQHLNELTPHPLALSLRWLAHHSALDAASGDGIILGASRPEQLEAALDGLLFLVGDLSERSARRRGRQQS